MKLFKNILFVLLAVVPKVANAQTSYDDEVAETYTLQIREHNTQRWETDSIVFVEERDFFSPGEAYLYLKYDCYKFVLEQFNENNDINTLYFYPRIYDANGALLKDDAMSEDSKQFLSLKLKRILTDEFRKQNGRCLSAFPSLSIWWIGETFDEKLANNLQVPKTLAR